MMTRMSLDFKLKITYDFGLAHVRMNMPLSEYPKTQSEEPTRKEKNKLQLYLKVCDESADPNLFNQTLSFNTIGNKNRMVFED